MLLNEVHSNYCKRVGLFYANFSLDHFAVFFLENSLTSQVTFSRFRSSFLSDIKSVAQFFANIKSVAEYQKEGPNSTVGSPYGYEPGGQLLASRWGQMFFTRLSFESSSSDISRFISSVVKTLTKPKFCFLDCKAILLVFEFLYRLSL